MNAERVVKPVCFSKYDFMSPVRASDPLDLTLNTLRLLVELSEAEVVLLLQQCFSKLGGSEFQLLRSENLQHLLSEQDSSDDL